MKNKWYFFILLLISAYASNCQELLPKKQLEALLLANYELQKMSINRSSDDLGTFFKEDTIYFSSNRKTRRAKQLIHKEDDTYVYNIYTAIKRKKRKKHKVSFLRGDVNTKLNQSLPVITEDGSTMYFTTNNIKNGTIQQELHIFKATKKDGNWTDIIDLPINSDAYSNGHAVLSADETQMYFVSDRDCKPGDSDIYKVQLHADGSYGIPERLRKGINTPREEITPYITENNAMYFSSKGHNGYGGFDVFYVDLNKKNATPVNLGPAINTLSDDFGFSMHEKTGKGFLSSNKEQTTNVYEVLEKKPIKQLLEDLKAEQLILQKLKGQVRAASIVSSSEAAFRKNSNELSLEEQLFFDCLKNCIELKVSKNLSRHAKAKITKLLDSLLNAKKTSTAQQLPKKLRETSQTKVKVAKTTPETLQEKKAQVMDYFKFNSSYLHASFKSKLKVLAQILKSDTTSKVQFYVHADARGTTDYNLLLTKKRLKRIETYLIKRGVQPSQVSGKAYGKSLILNDCVDGVSCKETSHKINRRVAYKWIRK